MTKLCTMGRPWPVCAMPTQLFTFCEWCNAFRDFGKGHFWTTNCMLHYLTIWWAFVLLPRRCNDNNLVKEDVKENTALVISSQYHKTIRGSELQFMTVKCRLCNTPLAHWSLHEFWQPRVRMWKDNWKINYRFYLSFSFSISKIRLSFLQFALRICSILQARAVNNRYMWDDPVSLLAWTVGPLCMETALQHAGKCYTGCFVCSQPWLQCTSEW